jgi:glucose/arabinose dehydrogenase
MRYLSLILLLGCLPWNEATSWPQLTLVPIVDNLNKPVHITHAGDGTGQMFVVEKAGRIHIIEQGHLLDTPFLDIANRVSRGWEQGLLSVAFPPNYTQKRYFYVNYTNNAGDTVIARYHRADSKQADPNSEEILLTISQPFSNHNGGQLAFGADGFLYIGMGDGGSGGDPQGHGQNPDSLLGKMLRLDVDTKPYAIPADNPFINNPKFRDEIWAFGLRNPWRFSFDRKTGDLYIADVGQNDFEEIHVQAADSKGGENYGWNIMEGLHCYNSSDCDQSNLIKPVLEYDHSQGDRSITGGYVYRGKEFPRMQGVYFYADYISGRLWGLQRTENDWETKLLLETSYNISTFGEDEVGNLYLADLNGTIYKVEGKVKNTQLTFEGLQPRYVVGDHLQVSLREQPQSRLIPLDLWVAIQLPESDTLLFLTTEPLEPFSIQPQPFKREVEVSEIEHPVLNLTISPDISNGTYTFYAIYNEVAADLSNLTLTLRSNIAMAQTITYTR